MLARLKPGLNIIKCTLKELVLIENLVSFARLPSYYPWILGRSKRIMWWGSFVTYEASARKCFHPDSKSIAHKSFVKTLSTPWTSFIFQSSSLLRASIKRRSTIFRPSSKFSQVQVWLGAAGMSGKSQNVSQRERERERHSIQFVAFLILKRTWAITIFMSV